MAESRIKTFNRWLHTFVGLLAAILLLFYGSTGFMLNHRSGMQKASDLPVIKGTFNARDLLSDTDKNKDAIAASLSAQFQINEKFRFSRWQGGHYIVHFASLKTYVDVEIDPKDASLEIKGHDQTLARAMMDLHRGGPGGESWHRVMDVAAISLVLMALSGLILWAGLVKRRWLGILALGFCALAVSVVLALL